MAEIDAYAEVLGAAQRRIWEQVAAAATAVGGELMGGTGVAVQLVHRVSVDLDVMTPEGFSGADLRDALEEEFGADVEVLNLGSHVCQAMIHGVHVDLISEAPGSPFAPNGVDHIAEGVSVCGMPVASLPDLLAAKLSAVAQRDTLRDYLDVAAIDERTRWKLEDGIGWYCKRYRLAPDTPMVNVLLQRLSEGDAAPVDPLMESLRQPVVSHLNERAATLAVHSTRRRLGEKGNGKPIIPDTQPKILKPPVLDPAPKPTTEDDT
ncbi:MAG: nucleotidyl transferase AbiEii/AbiGii toxin family protein [Acidimicrobiaceae bacterium]|nr:nucleotidyl transferase AbiEii/AbiGii toxin family protein [Acidimicrobiaceae bacterium]